MKDVHVLVIGAGMGGLALSLSLHRSGISTSLHEQAPELSEVGAGIMMTPNACRALMYLGAFDNVDEQALHPGATHYRDYRNWQIISTMAYDEAFQARYHGPYLTIHRADLQLALRDTLMARNPGILHLNHMIVDVEQKGDKVVAIFANGDRAEGDVLIACDGVRSVVREKVFHIDAPRFQGNVAFRGMSPIEKLSDDFRTPDTQTALGPGQHLVLYCVKKGAFVNWVAITEKNEWTAEGWNTLAEEGEVQSEFAAWDRRFHSLFDSAPPGSIYKWGLFDREPIERWVSGHVTLLGDSAHPTTPYMAQGAAMSFEDAVVLGRCLEGANTIEDALETYDAARSPRGGWVVTRSRDFGALYHAQASGDVINAERRSANEVLYPYDAATVPLPVLKK